MTYKISIKLESLGVQMKNATFSTNDNFRYYHYIHLSIKLYKTIQIFVICI